MKKIWRLLLIMSIIVTMSVLVGCRGDDDDDPVGPSATAFETLTAYLVDNDMDLSDMLADWIVGASVVEAAPSTYYILDIRSADDYALGHVEGAVNSTLGGILTDAANNGGKPIVVYCYTGQSACHAVIALRLSGYVDAQSMKWGMSGWHSDFDKWTTNTASIAVGHADWTTDATATVADFSDPSLTATATDGAGILAERVTAMLTGGFKGILAADVLASPSSYFINNYWAEVDVNTYGHITGAYRIKEDLTLDAGGFNNLDPSETVVTYCWTGQTSSMVTAYLTVLGYDAKSLKFGTNAMIYSELTGPKWSASADYTYVTKQ